MPLPTDADLDLAVPPGASPATRPDREKLNTALKGMTVEQRGNLVPVTRFGVVNNGTTDDTAAWQSALNSGEALWLPPSTGGSLITAPLVAPSATQHLVIKVRRDVSASVPPAA